MLEDCIYKDYIEARKARDTHKTEFLSFICAQLKNAGIDLKKRGGLDDNEVIAVLQKQKKCLEETKVSIVQSGRQELLDNAQRELAIISGYLPQPLSEEELLKVIDAVIKEVNAASMKDMSKVIKEVLARLGARADSQCVSRLVKNKLSVF